MVLNVLLYHIILYHVYWILAAIRLVWYGILQFNVPLDTV